MKAVYIGIEGGVLYGQPVLRVDDKIAAKMLEVYDKSREFRPAKIDPNTTVRVDSIDLCNVPIVVEIAGKIGRYSLIESRCFREALLAAENCVKENQ